MADEHDWTRECVSELGRVPPEIKDSIYYKVTIGLERLAVVLHIVNSSKVLSKRKI